LQNVNQ